MHAIFRMELERERKSEEKLRMGVAEFVLKI